jgi:hypothetical protein
MACFPYNNVALIIVPNSYNFKISQLEDLSIDFRDCLEVDEMRQKIEHAPPHPSPLPSGEREF